MTKTPTVTVEVEEEQHHEQEQTISVKIVRLGSKTKTLIVKQGTTLAEVREGIAADTLEVRVNGEAVSESYCLQNADIITVVPEAIVGGQ